MEVLLEPVQILYGPLLWFFLKKLQLTLAVLIIKTNITVYLVKYKHDLYK